MDEQGLAVATTLARRHPERTLFIRPMAPGQTPGMWQRSIATRERLELHRLELMPPLAALCPPPSIIDKKRYSAFAEPRLIDHLCRREADALSRLRIGD